LRYFRNEFYAIQAKYGYTYTPRRKHITGIDPYMRADIAECIVQLNASDFPAGNGITAVAGIVLPSTAKHRTPATSMTNAFIHVGIQLPAIAARAPASNRQNNYHLQISLW
jgi:hypothetical protein